MSDRKPTNPRLPQKLRIPVATLAAAIGLGGLRGAYIVAAVAAALTGVLLAVVRDAGHAAMVVGPTTSPSSTRAILAGHRRLFATLGFALRHQMPYLRQVARPILHEKGLLEE